MEAIAEQCVGHGGEGVLLARGLVAEANRDEVEYHDECIQELEEREGNSAMVASGESMHVVPNPASEILQLMIPEELRGQSLSIINAYGQTLGIVQTGHCQHGCFGICDGGLLHYHIWTK